MFLLIRHLRQKQARQDAAAAAATNGRQPAYDQSGQQYPQQQYSQQNQYQQQESYTPPAYPPAPVPQQPQRSTWEVWGPRLRLLAAIFVPVILETLDYTIVATSQTQIASVFNRLDLQSYIGTAYVLGSTVFLPIFGSLADIFGRFAGLQISLVIFLIGSALSTAAQNMPMLLVGRGIAGVGSAGLLSIVRILLSDSTNLEDNQTQASMMVILYAAGYVIGPILGGALLKVNWRWVFGINLPLGVVSMILIWILLWKRIKGPQPPARFNRLPGSVSDSLRAQMGTGFVAHLVRVDFIGAILFIGFGILLLLGLNWGSTQAWNDLKVILCLAISAFLLVIFVIWEYLVDHSTDHLAQSAYYASMDEEAMPTSHRNGGRAAVRSPSGNRARAARLSPKFTRVTDAMIPMNMFRSWDIIATDFAAMASGMIMLGIFYFVAIFFVVVNGSDAVSAGAALLYFAPGLGIGAIAGTVLIKRLRQPKYPIWVGGLILPIGVGLLAQALYDGDQSRIRNYMILTGVGVGIGFGPLSLQARFSQPESRVATVVSMNLFFRTFGGTLGLAQLSAVMYSRVRNYISDQVTSGAVTLEQAGQLATALTTIDASSGGILGLPQNLQMIIQSAFKDGLRWAFFSMLPWLIVAFVLCLFLSTIPEERLQGKPTAPTEQEEK